MNRRAAGRADGRRSSSALRRAGLLTGLLGVAGGFLTTPAAAAPADDAGTDRPVVVDVDRIEPRTVVPGAAVEVSGVLENTTDETWSDLTVRLQRGEVLTSRAELADAADDPDDVTNVVTSFQPVPGELAPGGRLPFSYLAPAEELQLDADGVYRVLVNVNGTDEEGFTERVGDLSTWLVAQPAEPATRTTVAWLWPLTDRPHRGPSGAFTDDDLAEQVASGGRLDRAVATLEQLAGVPAGAPGGSAPEVPVTLAVDPALLEELATMAAGDYTVDPPDGDPRAGTGSEAAAALLARLRGLADDHPVVALPYADVDASALVAAGRPAAVLRALPGTSAGTARQPLDDGAGLTDGATEAPTGDTGAGAGAAIVREVLEVTPRTDLAWPVGGAADPATLEVLQEGGASTVLLAEGAVTEGDRATGAVGRAATAAASVTTDGDPLPALVADGRLADLVAGVTTDPDPADGRLAEQRYLAELGALTTQLRGAGGQSVLVVPPRRVDPDPETVAAMMTDTARLPWLAPGSVASLATGPSVEVGEPVAEPAGERLSPAGVAELARAVAVRDDVAAAVSGEPATALAGYDAAIARAGSAAWRGDPAAFARTVSRVRETLLRLQDEVTLVSPAEGTYSLASSSAPLVLTVQNDLPFAVAVRVELQARGNVGLTTEDIGVQVLQPLSRTNLEVPAEVQQSGGFQVTAQLTTPSGAPLGEAVRLQVKSTAYGPVTLAITVGAAALLGLLFLRRLVRYLLARRRGTADEAPGAGDPAAPAPARSPV
ncbi:DUF6049 family protein [Modestobacter roseus]|uniref:DUF6049 family protein n=1 Tax=Modestobacter roseus TaxID=1181884 RepID=UPI0034DE7CAF